MRTEQEMMDLILGVAKADERIRAVYMNGSRANPNVKKDAYRDYDVVYTVTETESFIQDKELPLKFGEPLIVQEPDSNDLGWGIEHDFARRYAWLMLFKDGTRIDLGIEIKEETTKNFLEDTLTVPLLDKDGIFPKIPPSNDSGYWVKPPSKEKYYGCCNEFWWCLNNVAKGIIRDQLPYAMRMYTEIVHIELEKMTEWYIGINNDFSLTSGMWGKYFKKYLPMELFEMYERTYSGGTYADFWAAIDAACDLFHDLAVDVADYFDLTYRQSEEDGMRKYIRMMRDNG
ncbi:MAG: aminoglycoside 6-adenylyltransferase [Oscillospiraceae bacterium]|jgi:aminoglycoside 6-adenylyltransferase|nr:aminoglycoside 6-adenylyltransferase [Oscillospiraceae bacterium]